MCILNYFRFFLQLNSVSNRLLLSSSNRIAALGNAYTKETKQRIFCGDMPSNTDRITRSYVQMEMTSDHLQSLQNYFHVFAKL